MNDLAVITYQQGRLNETEDLLLRCIAIRRKVLSKDDPTLSVTINNLGCLLAERGRLMEAEPLLREALDIVARVLPENHPTIARQLSNLAGLYVEEDRPAEAEASYWDILSRLRRQPDARQQLPDTLYSLASALSKQNRAREAEPLIREGLAIQAEIVPGDNALTATLLRGMAGVLGEKGDLAEAAELNRQSIAMFRRLNPEHPEATLELGDLVDHLLRQGKLDEAEHLTLQSLPPASEDCPQRAGLLMVRANFLARRSRFKAAADITAQADEHTAIVLAVAQGDREGYRQHCRQALARFTATNEPSSVAVMAVDCLILSPSDVDLETVDRLTDLAVTLGRGNCYLPLFEFYKALAQYRLGQFARVVDYLSKPPATTGLSWDDRLHADRHTLLAMAHWQLHEAEAARTELAQARELAEARLPHADSPDLGTAWRYWIITQALLREAESLISPK